MCSTLWWQSALMGKVRILGKGDPHASKVDIDLVGSSRAAPNRHGRNNRPDAPSQARPATLAAHRAISMRRAGHSHRSACDCFPVEYINGAGNSLAVVPIHDTSLVFANVVSGSGARYAAGPYIWWEASGAVTLYSDSISGKIQSACHRVAAK